MCPRDGGRGEAISASPRARAPVPQSITTSVPAAERISMQEVLPP